VTTAIVAPVTRRRAAAALCATLVVLGACGAAEPTGPIGSETSSSTSTATGTTTSQSTESTSSSATESGPIPGFDGWLTINPDAADIGETLSGFGMTLTRRAQWSGASRGVLFYTTIDGDFRLTGTVRASRTSDSSQNPGGDGTTQLAGLMARHEGSTESWVVLEVGGNATGLVVATASTVDGVGRLVSTDWNDSEADLKICRTGTTFTFWKRTADSDDDWTAVGHADRKDLGGTLQVGASLSADAKPDLTAFFDNLTLEPMDPGEAC
jgi:hypothetical protein